MVMSTTFLDKETHKELDMIEFSNRVCFSIEGVNVEIDAEDVQIMTKFLLHWLEVNSFAK